MARRSCAWAVTLLAPRLRLLLALRWPSVCPVGVGDESAAAAAITATGESESGADSSRVTREIRDGYLDPTGEWRDGDTVTFDFPMPVRMLAADPLVREDAGKVAFVRGPITFCAEEKDNGANLHLLHADVEALLADPSAAKVEEFDFHAGAKGIDDKGQGEVEDVTRRMVKLEVPAWREPLPAAVAAAGEGAARFRRSHRSTPCTRRSSASPPPPRSSRTSPGPTAAKTK